MFNFKIIINMSNELVQTVKFLLLHWERLPKIREASADFIKKLDPFMKDLDPTLIVARQVNLELVNVIDRVFAFVKKIETQDINAFDALEETAKLNSELHQALTESKEIEQMVMDRLSEMKKELGI